MKIRCKKFLSMDKESKEVESRMGLTKGKEYIVLGISFSKHERHVYMHDDDEDQLPGYFDIRQFDIVSNYIPSTWIITYDENIDTLDLYPKSWLETKPGPNNESFWELFVDGDSDMVGLFEKEKELIYREEAEFELKQRNK